MRFSVLGSGSAGNAVYVETPGCRVLIDAGLSCREMISRLEKVDVDPKSLDALIITHEHGDHIKGAGPLARRLDIPVYLNALTMRKGMRALGNVFRPVVIQTGQTIIINGLVIETFTKCHDAADPMGVVLSSEETRLGLVTDLGRSTRLVEDRLMGCQALILESNHDERMLEEGLYPLEIKRRIRGPDGHLSNHQAGELLKAVSHERLAFVVLAHLSEHNNVPEMAVKMAEGVLERGGLTKTRVLASHQDVPIPMIEL